MKKYFKLSALSLLVSSLFLSSASTFAGTCSNDYYTNYHKSYKSEGPYKGEPVRHYKKPGYVQPCQNILLDGLYIGGALGYDSFKLRQYLGVNDGAGDSLGSSSFLNPTGVVGGAFIGYGYYLSLFYLGAEIYGYSSNAITTQSNSATAFGVSVLNYTSRVTVRGSYGISLNPGVKVSDTVLLYGRLGYTRASVRTNEYLTVGAIGGSTTFNTNTGSYYNGFSYGLGLEGLIYENWSLRGEYTHTQYTPINTKFGTRFIPSDNQVMFGVLYHFTFC